MTTRTGHENIVHRRIFIARAIVPAYEPNGAVPVRGPGEKRLYQDDGLATPEPAQNVVT